MDINKKLAEVVYIRKDQLNKARTSPFLCEVGPNERADKEPIYTADQLAAAVAAERERASVLYDMLLNRPALNAGLESEYAAWTSKCYQATGAYKAAIRAGAPPDTQNARRKTSAGA